MSRVTVSRARSTALAVVAAVTAVVLAGLLWQTSAEAVGEGQLRVATSPDVPADIRVDGRTRNRSGVAELTLGAGEHEVCFSGVDGYLTPPCETVTIVAGATTETTGRFERAGWITVETDPADLGVVIEVDGQPRDRDRVQVPTAVGDHEVCFGAVTGYTTPACQTVTVAADRTVDVRGHFVPVASGGDAASPDAPSTACRGRAHALAGDWDGSGRDGVGWWCDGRAELRTTSGVTYGFDYGRAGDVPVVADWDGDGVDTVSVIRDGTWHVNDRLAGGPAAHSFTYGRVSRGDTPIAGAWTGRDRDLPGVVRDRHWYLRDRQAGGPATWDFVYGRLTAGDLALWGDWSGNGVDTAGIIRGRQWHLRERHAAGAADHSYVYGRLTAGDVPVVGDWNGDGRDTPGIVRDGRWYLKHRHGGGPADRVIDLPAP